MPKLLPSESSHKDFNPYPKTLTLQTGSVINLARDLPSVYLRPSKAKDPTTAFPPEEPISRVFKGCVTPKCTLMWLAESSRALHRGYKDKYKKKRWCYVNYRDPDKLSGYYFCRCSQLPLKPFGYFDTFLF